MSSNKHEFHYIFSGSLTKEMVDLLLSYPDYEPVDVLVSQLDRSGVKSMMSYQDRGAVKSFFMDSGAFSAHTQGIHIDVDEYIDYINSLDDRLIAFAEVDTIPGKFQQPKSPEDYIISADKSWENYLYMHSRVQSPDKLVPVFHYGESFSALSRMLEWRGENGCKIEYLGISPANDVNQDAKNIYLKEVYDFVAKSSNPDVKTHLFGMTSLAALSKFPVYSADSVSHRLRAGYNKIFTRKWGTISLSDRSRTSKTKSNMSFDRSCDSDTLQEFKQFLAEYGFTLDEIKESSAKRTVVDMLETYKAANGEFLYHPAKIVKMKSLF